MKLHDDVKKQVLRKLRTGMSLRRVAELVGYSAPEIREAMLDDALFATEVRQARAEAELLLLEKMWGSMQWLAWKFLLQSLYPRRYVSSQRKPHARKVPKLESEETRLARLSAEELAALEPLIEKMDAKDKEAAGPAPRSDPQSPDGEKPA